MYWSEEDDKTLPWVAPDDIVDVVFKINCKQLPLQHTQALVDGIRHHLPWIDQEDYFAIHPLHVAESGNGWLRPDNERTQYLYPSKRTKFSLRSTKHRLDDCLALDGQTIPIDRIDLSFHQPKTKPLSNDSVIFSRAVTSHADESEQSFLDRCAEQIKIITGNPVKKMMAGTQHRIKLDKSILHTRHLMIADLNSDDSLALQQRGIGGNALYGCGIFIPHKGIKTLKPTD